MKLKAILFVTLFIHNVRAYSAFVDWNTRMNKYAGKLNIILSFFFRFQ